MDNADAPGQLPDSPTPRERVAAEAAERFVARGYQAVGLREIAVDRPALGDADAQIMLT
jgi:AcrR family transcriptional regulator